jgi:nitrogen fixation protein FixH
MSAHARSITGSHVFAIIVMFFGVIIAVNATLAILAVTSWTGLVVENGYVASQSFNRDLAEARRQAGLGWQESFGYANGRLTVMLTDSGQRPITRAAVMVKLQRPSTDREDHGLTLAEVASGKYVSAANLSPGLWDAETVVRSASGETLRHLYRLQISGGSAK